MITYSKTTEGKPDLDSLRDRSGIMVMNDLTIEVKITDARNRYGHLDLLVTPVAGSGEKWVEHHRVTVA